MNFEVTYSNLIKHNKNIFIRKNSEKLSWGSIDECINILKKGFVFCDKNLKIEDFVLTKGLKEVAKWMNNTEGKGIGLIGKSGAGKTLFLHGVLPHLLMNKGKVSYSVKAVDLDYSKNYLLIDEIGREGEVFIKGKGKVDRFPAFVDRMADSNHFFGFSSNMNKTQFIDRYGDYIYNRIMKKCKIIIFNEGGYWTKY